MGLAKSHFDPDPKNRKAKKYVLNGQIKVFKGKAYAKAEAIIDLVYVDIINGTTRTHIIKKLVEGLYDPQEGKGFKESYAREFYQAAFARLKADTAINREEAMALLLSRFDSVYSDCTLLGDHHAAIRALENLAKLYGLGKDESKTVEISKTDDKIKITFGFATNTETEENAD